VTLSKTIVIASPFGLLVMDAVESSNAAEARPTLQRPDGKPADQTTKVTIFISLGQSNMVGLGDIEPPDKPGTPAALMKADKKYAEFAGNVKAVDLRDLWREADVSPKNQGYHYNRSAETYLEVGLRLGWSMADLLKK
jgi:hypothetical protein